MSTYMRDYAHMSDDDMARIRAAMSDAAHRDADEPTPRAWRLNLLTAGTVIGGILIVAGGVYLGLLFGARPESDGLTDAELWTQNTTLMAKSAFAVIALFLGAQTLLFTAAGYFATRMFLALVRDLACPGSYAIARAHRVGHDGGQAVQLPSPEIMNSARRLARALFRSERRHAGTGDTAGDTDGHGNE